MTASLAPAPPAAPLTVFLVEPDALARRRTLRLLRAARDVRVLGDAACADSARGALGALDGGRPDLILADAITGPLDVPDGDDPLFVAIADDDALALRAFRRGAVDCVARPIVAQELSAALERVRDRLRQRALARAGEQLLGMLGDALRAEIGGVVPWAAGAGAATATRGAPGRGGRSRPMDRIAVRHGERVCFVAVDEVDWIGADGNYVRVHAAGAVHEVRGTLAAFEASLDPTRFVRIHRGTIVNVDRIREIKPWLTGDYLLSLRDGTELRLSRTYREQLQAILLG